MWASEQELEQELEATEQELELGLEESKQELELGPEESKQEPEPEPKEVQERLESPQALEDVLVESEDPQESEQATESVALGVG